MAPHRNLLAFASLLLVLACASLARAGGESIGSATPNAARFLLQNGKYVTDTPRAANLNPTGVNFADCEQDLRLDFSLDISDLQPSDNAHEEVWAGDIDCTQDTNRNQLNASTAHPCWQVGTLTWPQSAGAEAVIQSVYARDVLRYEQPPQSGAMGQPFDPGFHAGLHGEDACHVQTTDAAVPLTLYFMPVDSSGHAIGTAYAYPLTADMVAPPPPCEVTVQPGDNLLAVHWTSPGIDPDLVGFAVWTGVSGNRSCGNAALESPAWLVGQDHVPGTCSAGVSLLPAKNLAGEVDDITATELTVTGLEGRVRYAAVVTSVDGSGNFGPPSSPMCAEPTGSSSAPSSSSGATSPSSSAVPGSPTVTAGCGCAAAGGCAPGGAAIGLVAAALAGILRRRAQREPSD